MSPEVDSIVCQAEKSLAELYRETEVDLHIDWLTFRGVRSFLDNLIISPQFKQISVNGLLVHEKVQEIHDRLRDVRERANDLVDFNVSMSRVDIELLLSLALDPALKKYKRGTVPAYTAKVRAMVRQHEQQAAG